jgi:hypothetical protein
MKRIVILCLCLSSVFAKTDPQKILKSIDNQYSFLNSRMDGELLITDAKKRILKYDVTLFIKDFTKKRLIFSGPSFLNQDTGLIDKGVIYFKHHNWPKPDRISPNAEFLESPFTWGDILYDAIHTRFSVTNTFSTNVAGELYLVLQTKAVTNSVLYDGLVLFVRTNYSLYKVDYISADGTIQKTAEYNNHIYKNGALMSFRITMKHSFFKTDAVLTITNIKKEIKNNSFFSPSSIGWGAQRIKTGFSF